MDKEEAAPDQGGHLLNDVPLKNTTCVACGEPTGLRTGTGHYACLRCLLIWNRVEEIRP